MSEHMYGPGGHESSAISLAYENPEIARVYAILALASAVNRLATAYENARH